MRRILRAIRDPENAGFEFQTSGYTTKLAGNRLARALSVEKSVQKADSKRAHRVQLRRGKVAAPAVDAAATSESESTPMEI
jgi:hypothetical protein